MKKFVKHKSIVKKPNFRNPYLFKRSKWLKSFNKAFIFSKKVTFFKKLKAYFNDSRLLWLFILKNYSIVSKSIVKKYKTRVGHVKFFFFLQKFELRLSTLLLRARFFFKIVNALNAIKLNLILINGVIISNTNFLLTPYDLFQKRRKISPFKKRTKKFSFKKRKIRLKWRKYRWKKARFIFWQIRRSSNFNLFLSKKKTSFINFLEINYKIPAGVLLRIPLTSELLLNKQSKLSHIHFWKKIYYLF